MMNFVDAVQSGTGLSFDAQGMQKFKEVAATRKRRQMFLRPPPASPDQSTPAKTCAGSLGSGSHNAAQGFSLQEMDDDDILPADPLAPDPDDALTSQMFGPLSPNPPRPSNSPSTSGSTCSAATARPAWAAAEASTRSSASWNPASASAVR